MTDKVHLASEGAKVTRLWDRATPVRFNDYEVHVNRIRGPYVWHSHPDTDDVLMVLAGRLIIELRDREIELLPGEMFVVPAGVEHRPVAPEESLIMCIEPRGTAPAGGPSPPGA